MLTFFRTLLLVIAGWYLLKWLVRWISSGTKDEAGERGERGADRYESLTDQKVDDADYEDL
jgi:hypothetical protein